MPNRLSSFCARLANFLLNLLNRFNETTYSIFSLKIGLDFARLLMASRTTCPNGEKRAKKSCNMKNINDKRDSYKKIAFGAGILGAFGVVLGAFGAHALKDRLADAGTAQTWDTAVKYHLVHAAALLALAALVEVRESKTGARQRLLNWTARCWMTGVVLFSGSLYALALGGPKWLGPVTPLGGLALIMGWALVAASAWWD